jgi:hypothetical protein
MAVAVLAFVRCQGRNIPFWDEWQIVPLLTGDQPLTLEYLWRQYNEHRLPLPRLVLWGLGRLTGGDSRAGMYFNALALILLAWAFIRTSRRVRGRLGYADAFFPLALLHLGHWENLLWNFQVQFTLSTLLAGGLLTFVVRGREGLTRSHALTAGLSLVALPLCGANGLPWVVPLAGWMVFLALGRGPSGDRPGRCTVGILLTAGVAALVLLGGYFIGFRRGESHPAGAELHAAWTLSLHCLTISCGPGAGAWAPYLGAALGCLALAVGARLAITWRTLPAGRVRTAGLLLFGIALAGLVAALGWGRAGAVAPFAVCPRYATLTVLVPCWAFLAWGVAGPPAWRPAVQVSLYSLLCALLVGNNQHGLAWGSGRRHQFESVQSDLHARLPAAVIAQRHAFLFPDPNYVASCMDLMRSAGFRQFKHLPAPPELVEEEAGVPPEQPGGPPATLAFAPPRHVFGVRLVYRYDPEPAAGGGALVVAWHHARSPESPEGDRAVELAVAPAPGPQARVVYLDDVIDHISFRAPAEGFAVREVRLLLPRDGQGSGRTNLGRSPDKDNGPGAPAVRPAHYVQSAAAP